MIATLEGSKGVSLWERFSAWIVSTENRLYIGWFDFLKLTLRYAYLLHRYKSRNS